MSAIQSMVVFGTTAGLIGLSLLVTPGIRADDEHSANDKQRIEAGLHAAPVHLNYDKHSRDLVGLGSYLVNVTVGCNGCHSAGPTTEFAPGRNPFQRLGAFVPPKAENPTTYLAGGRDFGQVGPITSSTIPPRIISRNLTPDETGVPVGGFAEFFESIRKGVDADHLHPNCNGTSITANCFNAPFNGDVLQVMPWPELQDLTDRDLLAIYEYLRAVPCVASPGHNCA